MENIFFFSNYFLKKYSSFQREDLQVCENFWCLPGIISTVTEVFIHISECPMCLVFKSGFIACTASFQLKRYKLSHFNEKY